MTFRNQYTNLHTHTIGSMLDGHGKPEAYFQRASSLGMEGLGVTDHGNLHLLLDWYEAGKEAGVKPILGMEAYQARKSRFDRDEEERAGPARHEWDQRGPYHLTLIAKNLAGYHNLIKLSSKSYLDGYYVKPRLDYELLAEHSEGLIILSGCLNSAVQQAMLRQDYKGAALAATTLQDIVGKENFFLEIQNHGIEEQARVHSHMLELAEYIGAPIVPTNDCHYVHKHEAGAHDVMLCVSTNATIDQEERFRFSGPEFYLKSYEEMARIFEPEWLENSMNICDMIEVDLDFGELHFPSYPDVPKHVDVDTYLRSLVWAGIKERYGDDYGDDVKERTEHELGVVERMGFQEYFLVVSDIINWGKSQGIRFGPGRGSAAGSIMSYALKITDLDPLRFGLLFERFLVEGRKSMPDIDIDIDSRYRDKVIDYVRSKYGADRVAHICTFSREKAKSAIRDASRVLGYDYLTGDKLAKMIPPAELGVEKSIAQALELSPDFANAYANDPDATRIIDAAKGLEGVYRQTGIHAAGVLIAPGPIIDYAPLMQKGEDKPTVIQWDMYKAEKVGLLKIDFLGLRNLDIIDMCVDNVKRTRDIDIDVDSIAQDLADEITYLELCKGKSIGTFQTESPGMREMMLSLQPRTIEDIMALISLYRPGPMGVTDKMYINRKHGRENVEYPHAVLADVLDGSFGIMLYQEDVLNVLRVLAGYDIGQADDIRKVIGKKLMDKVDSYKDGFIEGCRQTNNVKPEIALKIWNDIKKFAGYGFGKAHAASYAVISYLTAYLKFNYPAEYMAALMTATVGDKDSMAIYLNECRKVGLKVLPPSILQSERDFIVSGENEILFGLSAISGIGDSIVASIVKDRDKLEDNPNIFSYFRDVEISVLNKATLEHLTRAGALDELSLVATPDLKQEDKAYLLELEREELNIYVTDHPLLAVWPFIESRITTDIASIETIEGNHSITLGGMINRVEKRITKKGQKMFKLTFEDMTGDIEVVVFPREASKLNDDTFQRGEIGFITGQLSRDGDEENPSYKIFYNSIEKLDPSLLTGTEPIRLHVDRALTSSELNKLDAIISSNAGDSTVYLERNDGHQTVVMKFNKRTKPEVKEALEKIIMIGSVEF